TRWLSCRGGRARRPLRAASVRPSGRAPMPPTTFPLQSVEPLAVKPATAWRLLDCGNTRGYKLLHTGELVSFLDGSSRKITVESIRNYIARQLAAVDRKKFQRSKRLPPTPKSKNTKGATRR